jgi:hypothetical protein
VGIVFVGFPKKPFKRYRKCVLQNVCFHPCMLLYVTTGSSWSMFPTCIVTYSLIHVPLHSGPCILSIHDENVPFVVLICNLQFYTPCDEAVLKPRHIHVIHGASFRWRRCAAGVQPNLKFSTHKNCLFQDAQTRIRYTIISSFRIFFSLILPWTYWSTALMNHLRNSDGRLMAARRWDGKWRKQCEPRYIPL